MAAVKVICNNLRFNPLCPHGPTLKFIREQEGGNKKEFFACSTYRDRKDCSFYMNAAEEQSAQLRLLWEFKTKKVLPKIDLCKSLERLNEVRSVPAKERIYCHTCNELDIAARADNHAGHQTQTGVSNSLLSHPSQMFKPKEGSKKEAQYLFTSSTTKVIVDNLRRAGVSRVICLGTPRIHEHIQAGQRDMQSLLLDLDHRHINFWPPEKFIWYNMFNRHILFEDKHVAKQTLRRFVAGGEPVALVMDPPFGGHVTALAATAKHFNQLVAKNHPTSQLLVIWVFPYFRERHILKSFPSLIMMDYKVQYENHKEFNNSGKGRKLGSPVRLFTNMAASQFELPASEGYRLCRPCSRWVASENKHCCKCNACTSKDGRTYVHCNICNMCVKPEWKHCNTCSRCSFSSHICQPNKNTTPLTLEEDEYLVDDLEETNEDTPTPSSTPILQNIKSSSSTDSSDLSHRSSSPTVETGNKKRQQYLNDIASKKAKFWEVAAETLSSNNDEGNIFGKHVGVQLSKMENLQKIIAEKLISEILFYAKLGKLRQSSKIVTHEEVNVANGHRQSNYSNHTTLGSSEMSLPPFLYPSHDAAAFDQTDESF